MSNTFGQLFRITTFGESHGTGVGVVIDGCPAGLDITREEIQNELDKRRPGQNNQTSPRQEIDQVEILSGIFENKTLGTPIALLVRNQDKKSSDYEKLKDLHRPGHADYTYEAKYGLRDWRGGGRASARETIGRVAGGAVAKKLLALVNIKIQGTVKSTGDIAEAQKNLDSVGGIIEIVVSGVPVGLGEPVFHKLSADLAGALMSIPAMKGMEIGDGFAVAGKHGSENNDQWIKKTNGQIGTTTNHAGGIIGGISTGEDIILRCAFKPTSSIAQAQQTINRDGQEQTIQVTGRHDPCVCERAVPVCKAMVALVIADHYLLNKTCRV